MLVICDNKWSLFIYLFFNKWSLNLSYPMPNISTSGSIHWRDPYMYMRRLQQYSLHCFNTMQLTEKIWNHTIMNWKDTHLFCVSNSLWKRKSFWWDSTGILSTSLLFYFLKEKICSKQQMVNNMLILSSKYWTFCYNAFFSSWHFINSFNPPNNPNIGVLNVSILQVRKRRQRMTRQLTQGCMTKGQS